MSGHIRRLFDFSFEAHANLKVAVPEICFSPLRLVLLNGIDQLLHRAEIVPQCFSTFTGDFVSAAGTSTDERLLTGDVANVFQLA